MKSFRTKALAQHMQLQRPINAPADTVKLPAPKGPNRRQRRYNQLFNRKLQEKLSKEKDKLPATFEVLPDGGLHVHVDARSEEKKAAVEEKADGAGV